LNRLCGVVQAVGQIPPRRPSGYSFQP
jgi:hypothetical protein